MGKGNKSVALTAVGIGVVILLSCFVTLCYLMSEVKPKKRMVSNKTDWLALLDYLPDPGPIVPGLLKATKEEIEEFERKNGEAPAPESKILSKIREKLNLPENFNSDQSPRIDAQGTVNHVLVKIFDETNQPKVEIKVRSDIKDNIQIKSNSRSKDPNNNIEIHVKNNETIVVANTMNPLLNSLNHARIVNEDK